MNQEQDQNKVKKRFQKGKTALFIGVGIFLLYLIGSASNDTTSKPVLAPQPNAFNSYSVEPQVESKTLPEPPNSQPTLSEVKPAKQTNTNYNNQSEVVKSPAAQESQPILSNDNYYTNSDGEMVHSPAYTQDDSVPAGATARCRDGTYSFSQSRRGTCSHHGGVAEWL